MPGEARPAPTVSTLVATELDFSYMGSKASFSPEAGRAVQRHQVKKSWNAFFNYREFVNIVNLIQLSCKYHERGAGRQQRWRQRQRRRRA